MIALSVVAMLVSAHDDGLLVLPHAEPLHFSASTSQISLTDAGVAAVLAKVSSLPFPSASAADVAKMYPLPSADIFQRPSLLVMSIDGIGSEILKDKSLQVPNLRSLMSSAESFPLVSTDLKSALSGGGKESIADLLSHRYETSPLIVCASFGSNPNTFCDERHTLIQRQEEMEGQIAIRSGTLNSRWETALNEADSSKSSPLADELAFVAGAPLALQNIPELAALASDQIPDMAVIAVDGVSAIADRHGAGSPQHREAIEALDSSLPQMMQPWQAMMGPATISTLLLHGSKQPLLDSAGSARKLLASADGKKYSAKKGRFQSAQAEYQMVLWTSIALIFIVYFIVAALFSMSYGADDAGLYSRYNSDRGDNKHDESKSN